MATSSLCNTKSIDFNKNERGHWCNNIKESTTSSSVDKKSIPPFMFKCLCCVKIYSDVLFSSKAGAIHGNTCVLVKKWFFMIDYQTDVSINICPFPILASHVLNLKYNDDSVLTCIENGQILNEKGIFSLRFLYL